MDDKVKVLFDGYVTDGEPNTVTVIGPSTVADDEIVPWRCPYECNDRQQDELGAVEFGKEWPSDHQEHATDRQCPEKVKVAIAQRASRPVLARLVEACHDWH